MPDLRAFKIIGDEATRITGYPSISIFHDFKYHPKMVIKGGDVDWIYDHLGAYAWVTEFWSPQRAAGLSEYHFIDWIREHSPEDELAVLKVADEVGEGYVDWYPFEHPQLGPVELGGWDLVRFWFNPPLSRLEEEVKPHADFAVYLALISPLLEIRSFESEPVANGAFHLRLVLENAGWLPTNVTERAIERKAVRPIEVDLELPDGARIASGKPREDAGQLGGSRRAAPDHLVEHRPLDRRASARRVGRRGEGRRPRLCGRAARARGNGSRRARPLEGRCATLRRAVTRPDTSSAATGPLVLADISGYSSSVLRGRRACARRVRGEPLRPRASRGTTSTAVRELPSDGVLRHLEPARRVSAHLVPPFTLSSWQATLLRRMPRTPIGAVAGRRSRLGRRVLRGLPASAWTQAQSMWQCWCGRARRPPSWSRHRVRARRRARS